MAKMETLRERANILRTLGQSFESPVIRVLVDNRAITAQHSF
jgi:hypothetical protein